MVLVLERRKRSALPTIPIRSHLWLAQECTAVQIALASRNSCVRYMVLPLWCAERMVSISAAEPGVLPLASPKGMPAPSPSFQDGVAGGQRQ